MKRFFTLYFILSVFFLESQTYTGTGGTVPGNNTYTYFNISVSGLTPASIDTVFGLYMVTINMVHPNTSDLRIRLYAPDGSNYVLTSYNGASGNDYTNTNFCDTAVNSITNASAPFTGYFKPTESLRPFNNGQNANGTWTLGIRDLTTTNNGSLTNWSITFNNCPAGGLCNYTSSNLPLVFINTLGQQIPYSNKITADMGIVYNGIANRNYLTDPRNHYNGKIGIEIHGQTSSGFPQLSYNIETRDVAGNDSDATIMGMPAESDWVLYGPYDDKTLMRNALTYKLSRDMGRWAARTRFCEVFVNGNYQGVYAFMEKIKKDSNRVDIATLSPTDVTGDQVTGGYIFSIDKGVTQWSSVYPPNGGSGQTINYQYNYPKPANIVAQQATYLQTYVDSFETALFGPNFQDPNTGYRKFISVKSFVDFFILNEIGRNVDGYRLSSYFHKDKYSKGGQLHAGPVWDFNLGWYNADYCDGGLATGWAYQFNNVCPGDNWLVPFWWDRLMSDSVFPNKLFCRWQELRTGILDTTNVFRLIDSMVTNVSEAQVRHFIKWPILGVYTWPNPSPLPDDFPEEILVMKSWIRQRFAWLDQNMPGAGPCAPLNGIKDNKDKEEVLVYPNPSNNFITIRSGAPLKRVTVFDGLGRVVLNLSGANKIDVSALAEGIYLVKGETVTSAFVRRIQVKH